MITFAGARPWGAILGMAVIACLFVMMVSHD
jgi:hypothetical protein